MMRAWVRGQFSLPFRMTVLPQARGVAMARTPKITGAFQGAMPNTTPAGWRTPMAKEPGTSEGMTSPATWVVKAAASRNMPAASITLNPAHMPVAPVSADTASMNAGVLASRASAALSSKARRWLGPVSLQVLKASAAASTANTASAVEQAGARVATVPSKGLRRSKTAPFSALTFRPLMSMDRSDMETPVGLTKGGKGSGRHGLALRGGTGRGGGVGGGSAQVGFADHGGAGQQPGRPTGHQGAALQHVGAVGHGQGFFDVLLHHQHGGPAVGDAPGDGQQLVNHARGQAQRGLVEHQQSRRGHHGPGDRHHLLLAAAHGAGQLR